MTDSLPAPIVNADSEPYWAAAREGKLCLQRCTSCSALRFPPGYLCRECGSEAVEWVPVSGRGVVHSFTIVHRAAFAEFQARTPYVIALVDLEQGPRMMTNIVGEGALEVAIGEAVEVVFEARGDDGLQAPQFARVKS